MEQQRYSETYKLMAMNLIVTPSNPLIQRLTYYVLRKG